jgi:hypothetical protein
MQNEIQNEMSGENPKENIEGISFPKTQETYGQQKSFEIMQLEELRYQRTLATQELLMEKFRKLERSVEKIEDLAKKNLQLNESSRFSEGEFWNDFDFVKDQRVKKATLVGFCTLLAIAIGLLLPYFKSEKLYLVNNDQALRALEDNTKENYQKMEHLLISNKMDSGESVINPSVEKIYYDKEQTGGFLVSNKYTNLRKRPSSSGDIIFVVPANFPVKLIEKNGDWFKISVKDYLENKDYLGWVFGELFRAVNH